MDPNSYTPEEIHAFTEYYIHSSAVQGHPFDLPREDQDRMATILAAALDSVREKARLESRWSPAQLYGTEEHLSHFVDSTMEKTGARCSLTFYSGSVFMDFTLPHVNELPSMDSKFWSRLAGLISSHGLTYTSDENYDAVSKTAANKAISKFVKAPIFVFLTEFHIAFQNDQKEVIDLGRFGKSIVFLESSWAEIIVSFAEVFKEFTRLSQNLYRSYYIKASNDPERRLSVADFDTVRSIYAWFFDQPGTWTKEDVEAAFPKATKIDILAAHELALERGIVSGVGKPFRILGKKELNE